MHPINFGISNCCKLNSFTILLATFVYQKTKSMLESEYSGAVLDLKVPKVSWEFQILYWVVLLLSLFFSFQIKNNQFLLCETIVYY
jgi:hypothetical protein